MPAEHPTDRIPLRCGHIYIAPSNHHPLVDSGYVRVTKAPAKTGILPPSTFCFAPWRWPTVLR